MLRKLFKALKKHTFVGKIFEFQARLCIFFFKFNDGEGLFLILCYQTEYCRQTKFCTQGIYVCPCPQILSSELCQLPQTNRLLLSSELFICALHVS